MRKNDGIENAERKRSNAGKCNENVGVNRFTSRTACAQRAALRGGQGGEGIPCEDFFAPDIPEQRQVGAARAKVCAKNWAKRIVPFSDGS